MEWSTDAKSVALQLRQAARKTLRGKRQRRRRGRGGLQREASKTRNCSNNCCACIMKKASVHEIAKQTSQRASGQKVRQNLDCSQVEDGDEDEIMDWQEQLE